MEKALIYVRLSTHRGDADPSTSPARQESVCRAYAEAKGWEVVDVVQDLDVSGSERGLRLDRPGLRRIRDMYHAIDVVVFAKLDRLARNVRDFAAIAEESREHDVALASVSESLDLTAPSGRFVATILAAFAELEAETIAERTRTGKAEATRQGRFTGGKVPYGYHVIDRPAGGRALEVDDAEANALRTMTYLYLDGKGGNSIARHLNASHVPTRSGIPWKGLVVMAMLRRHAEESEILTPPERHSLRDAIDSRRQPHRTPPADAATSLLTGLLRCSTCGGLLAKRARGAGGRKGAYVCSQDYEPTANHARVMADEADEYVSRVFLEDWSDWRPPVRRIPAEAYDLDVADAKDRVTALTAALTTADREDRRRAMDELEAAEDALQTLLDNPPSREAIFERGNEALGPLWERSSALDRRDLLREYLGTVLCTPARDAEGRTIPTPERLTIPRIDDADPELA